MLLTPSAFFVSEAFSFAMDESGVLKDKMIVLFFRNCFDNNPEGFECLRELCRRLCVQFGLWKMVQPILDLGMTLTRAKCVQGGVPYDKLKLTLADTMTPGIHRKGIQSFIDEGNEALWKQVVQECQSGREVLQDLLWADTLVNVCGEELACEVHAVLKDVELLLQDLEHHLRLVLKVRERYFASPAKAPLQSLLSGVELDC